MKSRWTIYLLSAVVAVVWGTVGWKILAPGPKEGVPPPMKSEKTSPPVPVDTLRCDYPDPFLKNSIREIRPANNPVVRPLPVAPARQKREKTNLIHCGTVVSDRTALYIVTVNGAQYEVRPGEAAGDFRFEKADADSLYFVKSGLTYGVVRCI